MDIGETGLAGQVAWLRFLADTDPDHAWQEGSGLAVVTGLSSNSDNGIAVDRAGLRNEEAVRSLVRNVLERGVPASLVVSEPAIESEVGLLLELGLKPENSANEMGMTVTARPEILPPPSVEISEVLDQELLHEGYGHSEPTGSMKPSASGTWIATHGWATDPTIGFGTGSPIVTVM